jgi:hypothetical protein
MYFQMARELMVAAKVLATVKTPKSLRPFMATGVSPRSVEQIMAGVATEEVFEMEGAVEWPAPMKTFSTLRRHG